MSVIILPVLLLVILLLFLWFRDVWYPPEGQGERKKWRSVFHHASAGHEHRNQYAVLAQSENDSVNMPPVLQ